MNKKQKIGLVLGGGGGKGAYQIGVLKALKEYKFEKYINYMSGTSVGSLNMILYLSGGVEKCLKVWENINMDVALSKKRLVDMITKKSLFSREGAIKLANENVDFKKVSNSKIQAYVMASPLKIGKQRKNIKDTFLVNGMSKEQIMNLILASSALPFIFEPITIDGVRYMDGYMADNVPIKVLKSQGCKLIFVVPLKEESPAEKYADDETLIIDFVSGYNDYGIIDGTLDFNSKRAKMRIEHGYNVAVQLIEKLINDGIIAVTIKQKIRQKWLKFRKKINNDNKNYFALSKNEIKHRPLTLPHDNKNMKFKKIEKEVISSSSKNKESEKK